MAVPVGPTHFRIISHALIDFLYLVLCCKLRNCLYTYFIVILLTVPVCVVLSDSLTSWFEVLTLSLYCETLIQTGSLVTGECV